MPRRSKAFRALFLALIVTASAAACSEARQPSGDFVGIGGPPISAGIRVVNFRAASKLLSFEALRPSGLGAARTVLVSDPTKVSRQSRAIAFLFHTRRYGRVNVVEELAGLPRAEYDAENRALLAENGSPQTHGSVSVVTVRHDKQALITTGEGVSTSDIFWMEQQGVEISISGSSLDASACVEIANAI